MQYYFKYILPLLLLSMACCSIAYAEIVPTDSSPLGKRIPLILIHGIRPAKSKQYDWQPFLTYSKVHPEFPSRYKPYLFIYPPAELIDHNAKILQQELIQYRKLHPEAKPFRFLAQSLGGIVLRETLNNAELWQQTDRVIALGCAYHGSPLTNSHWMRARLKQASFFSKFRRLNRISYWIFGRLFPHYKEDLCWDNFDGLMPDEHLKQHTCQPRVSIHPSQEEIQKYIVYAGFFGETFKERELLRSSLGAPKAIAEKKFTPPLSRHLITYLIRPDLAYIPLKINNQTRLVTSLMWYNDGVSPIASQLWLGRYLERVPRPIPPEIEWQALGALKDSQNVRLFEGLDHGDWLKGTTRYRNADGKLLDWLHPEQPSQEVFSWILTDLLR